MPVVKISEVRIGQELCEDVEYKKGIILFKAGEKIDEKHVKAFKAWGITEVCIRQNAKAVSGSGQSDEAESGAVYSQDVEYKFSITDESDPVIAELKRISMQISANGG